MAGKTNQSTRDEMLRLTLQAKRSTSCIVVLPAEREYLDAVKVYLGVEDFTEAQIRDVRFKVPYIGEYIRTPDCPSVLHYCVHKGNDIKQPVMRRLSAAHDGLCCFLSAVLSRTGLLAAGSFRRLTAAGEIGSLLAAVSIAGTLAAVSGASHTAGGNAAGLGGGGQGGVPGGQGIAAVGGQLRGGEEHKVGIAQGSAAVNGAAVAAGDGHSGVLGDAGAAAVHVTGASAAHTAGGAEGDAGLLRRQVHSSPYRRCRLPPAPCRRRR